MKRIAMNEASLIFPTQLFKQNPVLKKDRFIFIIESPRYFTDFKFHKKKLLLHRASMKYYEDYLKKQGYEVDYIEYNKDLSKKIKSFDIIHYIDLVDKKLEKDIQSLGIKTVKYVSPAFITTKNEFQEFFSDKKQYSMTPFYIYLRKKHKILLEKGKAKGEKWTYDKENRKKVPQDIQIPKIKEYGKNKYVDEAKKYVNKNFPDNYGNTKGFIYPIMHEGAEVWLQNFLKERLYLFGDYEDAICKNESFLFHSILSYALNIGLLTPIGVINQALDHSKKNNIPLNSIEGFVRQILGWREYIKNIYLLEGEKEKESNYWNHSKTLPYSFYTASIGIEPIDITIKKVVKNSYCHHIERLMVLSNFMLLCEVNPNEIYKWFMEMFIDAYEWVMVPNVYGMGAFADGGLIMSKPYISSSNYIKKMSDFEHNGWCEIWDGLYWRFIANHIDYFEKNPRLRIMTTYLTRINEAKLKQHIKIANDFSAILYK